MQRRVLTFLLAIVFLGGASLGAVRLATAQSNDVLTISQGADTDTLSPITTAVTPSSNVFNQIFDGSGRPRSERQAGAGSGDVVEADFGDEMAIQLAPRREVLERRSVYERRRQVHGRESSRPRI